MSATRNGAYPPPSIPYPQSDTGPRRTPRVRITPQSLDAEQATLGACLMDEGAMRLARQWLQVNDFYRELHKKIFAVMVEMHDTGRPLDLVDLAEELRKRDQLHEVGGGEYLTALLEACPSSANVVAYARIVADLSQKRQLSVISHELEALSLNGKSGGEVREWLQTQLDALKERAAAPEPARAWTAAQLMATEFEPTKCAVESLLPIGLTLLAGKPKIGKSWLSYALALSVAMGGMALGKHAVQAGEALYLSLEDTPRRLKSRLSVLLAGEAAPETLHLMCDWPRLDAGGMERLDSWIEQHPDCRLVVIDTFQKIRPKRAGGNIYEEDYEHLGNLKKLADKHEISIVAVLHVSKRDTSDVMESVSGSEGQNGAADATLVLRRARNTREGSLYVTGREMDERDIPLRWSPEVGTWVEIDEDEAREANMSAERREILDVLEEAGHALLPREIADALGKKPGNVHKLLFSMKNAEEVRRDEGTGKYSLTSLPSYRSYRENGDSNEDTKNSGNGGKTGKTVRPEREEMSANPPDWLRESAIAAGYSPSRAAEFWRFWRGRYESPLDYESFAHYFPLWMKKEWPPQGEEVKHESGS